MSRWGDCYGGLTCLFSLYRMAGDYPNFVSLCEYLHVLVCPWLPFQEPTSLRFHGTKDRLESREWDEDEVKDRKVEGSGFSERQWLENDAGIGKKAAW